MTSQAQNMLADWEDLCSIGQAVAVAGAPAIEQVDTRITDFFHQRRTCLGFPLISGAVGAGMAANTGSGVLPRLRSGNVTAGNLGKAGRYAGPRISTVCRDGP